MKVFISSLIAGFEDMRAAVASAIRSLGHEPVTAENFDAGLVSPRVACLRGVREADLIVLILGEAYGAVQANSGISATHEEWREAKDRRPVMAFVQEGITYEPLQDEFVREVQNWTGGLFRSGFRDAEELRDKVTRAIHRLELTNAATAVDSSEMLLQAQALIPKEGHGYTRMTGPLLHVAVVGGPAQTILRPVEIERPELALMLMREATYGNHPVFDPTLGSKNALIAGALHLHQESGAAIVLNERGSVRLSVPVVRGTGMAGAIIEENVTDALDRSLGRAADILDHVDDAQRLSRLVFVASLDGEGTMGWRTRREDDANPNSMTMSHSFGQNDRVPVHFQPPDRPRASLAFDRARMVEDTVALLRRQWI
jgi:Domain of unknown function (DUF4062)